MKNIALGIDIGGTNTDLAFVDRDGHFLAEDRLSTSGFPQPEVFVAALAEKVKLLNKSLPEPVNIIGIGIGAPMGNINKGTIEEPADLPWKGITPLADLLREHIDLPILVTNDANADAVGEMVFGAAKGLLIVSVIFIMITHFVPKGSTFISGSKLSPHVAEISKSMTLFVSKNARKDFAKKLEGLL